MNCRSWIPRTITIAALGVSLTGCAVYPGGPYSYGRGAGYQPYVHAAPSWGRRGYDRPYAHRGESGGWRGREGWR